ncbi:MAG: phytanoyl-CoA dioxygenase family protein [Acidimicrobiia bacterium]|nr:phytanoyl-CoA dioxygenase family protein [Acidimicrobiia bacterium]
MQASRLAGLGWNESVPPNGLHNRRAAANATNDNPLGLDTPVGDVEIETTPEHRNLVAGDPRCSNWTRRYDDPGVSALRVRMWERNGIRGLEVCEPGEVERAAALFHRDGFVAVSDAVPPKQLDRLRDVAADVIEQLVEADPDASVGGGAGGLPHRYSFGATSASRHLFHRPEWCELIDMPTTTPILTAIFGSANYIVYGCGGDIAFPGAIEYQGLHSDNVWSELHDPVGRVSVRDLPVPVVHINFPLVDLTPENGPIRQIPGTQRSRAPIPALADEPEWMRFSTVCPLPAGSAIIRDARCWHGGTPNLSHEVRAMPNVEYFAPWFRSEALQRSMSYETWRTLTPHAQRLARYVVGFPGEPVAGAGFHHPRRAVREERVAADIAAMGEPVASEYRRRL